MAAFREHLEDAIAGDAFASIDLPHTLLETCLKGEIHGTSIALAAPWCGLGGCELIGRAKSLPIMEEGAAATREG
jgi:hypothetical protein